MKKTLVLLTFVATAAFAGAAQAQIKCWSEGGKRVCGDAPPAGARVTTLATPAAPEAPPAAASKDGKKRGPLTPAEQEQDYRKRQAEAKKDAEKADKERKAADAKRENCERAKEALRSLESGQRNVRVDSKGERYFLDEAQTAQETAKARQTMQDSCN